MSKHKEFTTLKWLKFAVTHNSILFFWMMVKNIRDGWDKIKMWFFIATRQGSAIDYHRKVLAADLSKGGTENDMVEAMFQFKFCRELLSGLGFSKEIDFYVSQVWSTQGALYAFDRETCEHVSRVKGFETVGDALQLWYDYDEVSERRVRYFFGDDYEWVYNEKSYTDAYKYLQKAIVRHANDNHGTTTFTPTGAQYAAA